MDSFDTSDFTIMPSAGTRLLSESPLSKAYSGSTGGDLSLSELSISTRPYQTEGNTIEPPDALQNENKSPEQADEGADEIDPEELERTRRQAAKTREEKLQHDLFLLKKLNGAFALYTDALRATQSSTERLKARLKDTNALLDKYVGMLDRSESITKLILDERWQGADADEEFLLRQREEMIANMRKEAEERELAEQRERERLEIERHEKEEREERERIEKEMRDVKSTRGVPSSGMTRKSRSNADSGVRGVRGTRASMRARGVARGLVTTTAIPSQTTSRIARPASSASGSGSARARARGS